MSSLKPDMLDLRKPAELFLSCIPGLLEGKDSGNIFTYREAMSEPRGSDAAVANNGVHDLATLAESISEVSTLPSTSDQYSDVCEWAVGVVILFT